jgi:outer membrane receptor for ferrienterochelin and colicin
MKTYYSFLLSIFCLSIYSQSKFTISGYVTEGGSKENLPGVSIIIPKLKTSVSSNSYGFYSITLPADTFELYFYYTGYKSVKQRLFLDKNMMLNVELAPELLAEVEVIAAENISESDKTQMSSIDIPIEQIKQIPALFGEKDVLKVIQLMPGVQKGNEGSSGIYVRGGGPDQNLIILDEATVYNASHLFGFFSVFNGDALKSIELVKGGFPARYGGRLSSVIDLQMKEGSKEAIKGEAGIGLISSRLTLEGPIIKDKCSFLISGRRTYIDALIYPFQKKEARGGYFFYDFNAKVNYVISDKDRLYLSGYFGRDKFYFNSRSNFSQSKTSLNWGNATSTLRWNHLFSNRLFSNASLIFTNYKFEIGANEKQQNDFFNLNYSSFIRDFGFKYQFEYIPSTNHYIRFGATSIWHHFQPQALVLKSSYFQENISSRSRAYDAIESGLYIEDDWIISQKLRANAGFRVSSFYVNGKHYLNPEPRASIRYLMLSDFSIKASYAMMNQYLHLLSNTGIGLPTDLWVPATNRTSPQQSQQIALGIAKDFPDKQTLLTIEGYYKWMNNVIQYKDGASFLDINSNNEDATGVNWENNVTAGSGLSYGAEFLLQKKYGKFTGWVGYTLSWTWLQFDSLNFGKRFPARYDRRHDVSLVGMYKLNKKINLAATWVYGTGNAITLPTGSYYVEQNPIPNTVGQEFGLASVVTDYGEKNSFRMGAYHRFDVSVQFHKQLKRCERIFEISVYNLYNRMNPYYYFIEYGENNQNNKLKQVSLFPLLPSVSWTFKF